MNLKCQRRVLQMQLSGGGDYLDFADDVDNSITAQDLTCNCKKKS